ncbi:MAG: bifunctional metallophosphatase/5'-nucleotidase [Ignavibacteriales bacterium]|nr:bifunctional metallophosphatase/5'-nucleotidase [Ignavibacteriales bacterium]
MRIFKLLFLSLLLFSFSSSQPKTITILHTNDMHASFIPKEATWSKKEPKPMVGGMNELFFMSDSIKKVKTCLMFDAGDVMTGNPITEYKYQNAFGGALFEMMNRVGYDAWCFGNHDLDAGQENLLAITKIVHFPILSSNVVNDKNDFPLNNKPYTIIEKGGLKIGIIGVMSQFLYNLVNESNLKGIKVLSPSETVQKYVDELDPKTDLLIALTHEGTDDDSILAENVHGLDVIVGGHSHTRLTKPLKINDVIIVQAGANCENLGELELTVENDKVTDYKGKLLTLWYRDDRPKNELSNFIDSVKTVIDKDYSEVIAELKSDWRRTNGENNVGNFICDAQKEIAQADVAFTNSHGIRKDVLAGPLTKKELFEVLPFQNMMTTFQLSGKQLQEVVEYIINKKPAVQLSGIKCVYTKSKDEIEIDKLEINGKKIDEDKMYICTASDFFVGEADRYIGVKPNNVITSNTTVFKAVEQYVRQMKVIDSQIEHRIEQDK